MRNTARSVHYKAQKFADLTKSLIITGNIARVKKCLAVAEKLLLTGSAETRNAISNVYVFSVSSFMEVHNCSIANLFPQSLRKEYNMQINASGV